MKIDIGDGRGPQPQYHLPMLGQFKTDWTFRWGEVDEAVAVEVAVEVPGVGTMTHHAVVPFAVQDAADDVELEVTHTTIHWADYRVGMSQLRQAEQLEQIVRELQCHEMLGYLPYLPTASLATKRRGRRGRRLIEYAEIARRYVELHAAGDQAPTKALAGELHVSRKQAENLIYRCREKGLLSAPAKRGAAGGQLTQLCIDTLADHEVKAP